MIFLWLALSFNVPSSAQAHKVPHCAEYSFTGKVIKNKGTVELLIFPKSKSETRLNISGQELENYGGFTITGKGKVHMPASRYRGKLQIKEFTTAVANPLEPNGGHKLDLIKEVNCP